MVVYTHGSIEFHLDGSITGKEPGKDIPVEAWLGFYKYHRENAASEADKDRCQAAIDWLRGRL